MEGLRNFIEVDNHCSLEVVRRPEFKEGCSEVLMEESPEDLTMTAEEVGSQNSCINVGRIAEDRWDRPWLTLFGMPFAKQSTKEMSEAAGVEKSNESQNSKGHLEDEGGQRQERGFP